MKPILYITILFSFTLIGCGKATNDVNQNANANTPKNSSETQYPEVYGVDLDDVENTVDELNATTANQNAMIEEGE